MLSARRRHCRERGQALLMALAFIAFFGLVSVAVLRLAGVTFLAQTNAEALVGQHATAQGAALFAAADARRRSMIAFGQQFSAGSCLPGATARMSMPDGSLLGYTITGCNPGATADDLGRQCAVCVLDTATINGRLAAADGPIAFNANPGGTGTVRSDFTVAGGLNPGFIGCAPGDGCLRGDVAFQPSPAPLTQALLATPPPPPATGGSCPGLSGDTFRPGTYYPWCDDSTQPGHAYTLESGVYTFEEGFRIDTGSSVTADGPVLLYFTGGAQLYLDSGSTLEVSAGAGSLGTAPLLEGGSLPAADVVIFFDPSDACHPGEDVEHACLTIQDGASLKAAGTVYLPAGSASVFGSMAITPTPTGFPSGALVVGDLRIDSSGTVDVDSAPPSDGYCFVYDDSAWAQIGSSTLRAHVIVASNCQGGSGIVAFQYGS